MTYQDQTAKLNEHSQRWLYDLTKRLFDIIVSAMGLTFLAPLWLIIGILIKIDSPGPIFLEQNRIGRWGKPFGVLKFRTIYYKVDQEEQRSLRDESGEAVFKIANDSRVTRVGSILRKAYVDELPQLFNVLRGEMGLVGPRPALAYELEFYQDWHNRRLEATPGITGLWQIQGSGVFNFDEMVKLDIWYIEHRSFWLDLKILLQTVPAALRGKGAY